MKPSKIAQTLIYGGLALCITQNAVCKDKLEERIIYPGGIESKVEEKNINANQKYELALNYVKNNDYKNALDAFVSVIEAGPVKNKHYADATKWLDEKVWKHMLNHYIKTMEGKYQAASVLMEKANKLPAESKERKKLMDKARNYLKDVLEKNEKNKEAADNVED